MRYKLFGVLFRKLRMVLVFLLKKRMERREMIKREIAILEKALEKVNFV